MVEDEDNCSYRVNLQEELVTLIILSSVRTLTQGVPNSRRSASPVTWS